MSQPEAKPAPKEATPPKEEVKPEEEVPEQAPEPEPEAEKEEEPLPTDSEVPNLEQLPDSELPPDEQPEKGDACKEEKDETEASPDAASLTGTEAGEAIAVTEAPAEPPKTEEELALERQLADVQRQLAALSSLPSTIQSTLDAVTKQLGELLPTFKLQQQERRASQEDGQQPQLPQIDEKQEQEQEEDAGTGAGNYAQVDSN